MINLLSEKSFFLGNLPRKSVRGDAVLVQLFEEDLEQTFFSLRSFIQVRAIWIFA